MKTTKGLIFCLVIISCILLNVEYARSFNNNSENSAGFGIPVLPGVSGFGLDAVGGKGGKIIAVTNLNRDGKGSLAEALDAEGPRIIVFEVAGVIDLDRKSLRVTNPFVTIAGQTAPSPGITLIKGALVIATHEVIVQHVRARPGEAGFPKKSGWEPDGIATTGGAYNVIIDHCTATWAPDENLSASGPRFNGSNVDEWRKNTSHRVTISNSIIAQGLSNSTHEKGEHSKGTLIHDNATDILLYGNLYADNMDRHPLAKGGSQTAVVNNYIFNPGRAVVHYALNAGEWEGHEWVTGKITVEGNYIEYGPDTSENIYVGRFRGPVEVYWKDNKVVSNTTVNEFLGTPTFMANRPVWPDGLTPMPAAEVKEHVLQNAGAFPWDRDELDRKLVAAVRDGNGKIIDSEVEAGGYPVVTPVYQKFNADEWDLLTMTKK